MFHKHKWVELERFYAPPREGVKAESLSQRMMEEMCFGVTTILYMCSGCLKMKTVVVLGQSLKG